MDYVELKLCKKCNTKKPLNSEHFDRSKKLKSGFQSYCKSCKSELNKKYIEQNRDKVKAKQMEWHYENKERANKRSRDYWNKNKEKINALQRAKRIIDPEFREKGVLRSREYAKNNQDKITARKEADKLKRQQKRIEKANAKEIWIDDVLHKKCTKCSEVKPATTEYFYKFKKASDGLSSHCITCVLQNRKDIIKNPERHERQKDRMREWARVNSAKNKVKYLESKIIISE